jgi:hypothetical protein
VGSVTALSCQCSLDAMGEDTNGIMHFPTGHLKPIRPGLAENGFDWIWFSMG